MHNLPCASNYDIRGGPGGWANKIFGHGASRGTCCRKWSRFSYLFTCCKKLFTHTDKNWDMWWVPRTCHVSHEYCTTYRESYVHHEHRDQSTLHRKKDNQTTENLAGRYTSNTTHPDYHRNVREHLITLSEEKGDHSYHSDGMAFTIFQS